uniref:Uncharacterized protein n=1 Tax=Ovis aries TaxID=9940 RepID=A0AC11EB17_SHEEP
MAAVETRVCETDGCSSEAKLQCPTCIKLGIQGSYFCSQGRHCHLPKFHILLSKAHLTSHSRMSGSR